MKAINRWLCKTFEHKGNDVKIIDVVLSENSLKILISMFFGFIAENIGAAKSSNDPILTSKTILFGAIIYIGFYVLEYLLALNIAHCERKE